MQKYQVNNINFKELMILDLKKMGFEEIVLNQTFKKGTSYINLLYEYITFNDCSANEKERKLNIERLIDMAFQKKWVYLK